MTEENHPPPLMAHPGITCDQCGVKPISGTRYKARFLHDYDLCPKCYDGYRGSATDFVAFERPKTNENATKGTPRNSSNSENDDKTLFELYIPSKYFLQKALEELRNNENLKTVNLGIGNLSMDDYKELGEGLRAMANVETLHLHMCSRDQYGDGIADLAKGIMANCSLKKVYWHMPQADRVHASDKVTLALREMIEKNKTINCLAFGRACKATLSNDKKQVDAAEDRFAQTVVEGLRKNRKVRTFQFNGFHSLSVSSKKLIFDIVEQNGTLEHVVTKFEDEDPSDYRLELLLASNRDKWVKRLSDERAPARDRVQVLVEAQSSAYVDEVPAIFYLLRSSPDVCKLISS